MPEPPTALSPAAERRLERVETRAGAVADAHATVPAPDDRVGSARGAVEEPTAETSARAEGDLVAALESRAEPSPEIAELCDHIRRVIRERRPVDEDSLVDARPREMADAAQTDVAGRAEAQAEGVTNQYDAIDHPPDRAPTLEGGEVAPTPPTAETASPRAESGRPDPVSPESVSLDADVAAQGARMEEAGMNSPAAQLVEDGPIAEARAAHGELTTVAERSPAEVLAEQQTALESASADMRALQLRAAQALEASRTRSVAADSTQQTGMVGSEEQTRERIGREAQTIFDDTRTAVNGMIEPLPRMALDRFDREKDILSTQFESTLAEVRRWITERHSGVGGFFVGIGDAITGLPGWVTRTYNTAEEDFGNGICRVITEISTQVNSVILAAEELIADANRRIAALFTGLDPSLAEWAAAQRAQFEERLTGLTTEIHTTRDNFNRDIRDRAGQAVDEVRARIAELRAEAGGLIGRIATAIGEFIDDPVRAIINGLLRILGISPPSFWAVVRRIGEVIDRIADDPLAFGENLLASLGQGFRQFFDHIGTHLLNGFLRWLFSGLGSVGVTIPRDFSLPSVITFFLQLMGITWPRVRAILARHIGPQNVELIEQAWGLVSTLIERGPAGIYEMVREQLNPQNILDAILDAAIEYLTEALITRVTARILMMFNPAGAILQAVEAIYRVLKWVFQNAAQIFSLVETVVNGISDLLDGNIGGMANAVENALARLIPPVIDFLADYIGLGGLPDAIASAVRGLQGWVEGLLERVIGWLASRARGLLRALGVGGSPRTGAGDTELGTTVRFRGGGEGHRLFVTQQSGGATLMVASVPMTVPQRLTDWRGRLPNLSDTATPTGPAPRARATDLLARADILHAEANTEGDRLAATWGTAAAAPAPRPAAAAAATTTAPPSDDVLEGKEQELANILRELFELFGDRPAGGNAGERLLLAQSVDRFHSDFRSADWATYFGIDERTAQSDLQEGRARGRVDAGSSTYTYVIGTLSESERIRIAVEEILAAGTRAPFLSEPRGFGVAQIRSFCIQSPRLPNSPARFTDRMCGLIGDRLVRANAAMTLRGGRWKLLPMPPQRMLPDGFDVRTRYYINGSGFGSAAERVRTAGVDEIRAAIRLFNEGRPRLAQAAWDDLYARDMVATETYVPSRRYITRSLFDVDHTEALAQHWVAGGWDSTWPERQRVAGNERNLRLMLFSENRSRGAEGATYRSMFYVGPNFTGPGTSAGPEFADVGVRFTNM